MTVLPPIDNRGKAIIALRGTQFIFGMAALLLLWHIYKNVQFQRLNEGTIGYEEYNNVLEALKMFSVLYNFLYAVVSVGFLLWLHIAHENIERVSIKQIYKGYSAIWSWFVPLANFYIPFRIMQETYRGTQLAQKKENTPIKKAKELNMWWGVWVLSCIINIIAHTLYKFAETPEMTNFANNLLFGDLCFAVLSLFLGVRFMQALMEEEQKLWLMYQKQEVEEEIKDTKPISPSSDNKTTWV